MSDAMSGQPRPGPGQAGEPSEEEVRAYLAQLRQADVAEILAQAFSMLASGAEVKLGRRDGRLLIDASAAVADAVEGKVDARLTQQMEQAVSQLRMAQVDAEEQLAQMRAEGKLPGDEAGDLPEEPGSAPPSGGPASDQGSGTGDPAQGGQRPSAASRLWVPGR